MWENVHQLAFNEIKQHMTSKLCLGYFDTNDETQVCADASPVSLGAV